MNTDRFLNIFAGEYNAASRSGQYLSSHLLADFRSSPELYRRKISGEIAEQESPALVLGRAAHCLILEGCAAFDRQYLVADGRVCGIHELAQAIGHDHSYVSRIMRLATLAPAVIERVIASQELPPGLNASRARKSVPLLWKEQLREFLGE
jgi:hypothetical protein